MIGLKMAEEKSGKKLTLISSRADQWLIRTGRKIDGVLYKVNWRTMVLLYHFILEKVENLFLIIYRQIRNKLTKTVNLVKGEGKVNEEKSSTSFFLKNIEEHKSKHKK